MTIANNIENIGNLIESIAFICWARGISNPTIKQVMEIMEEQRCYIRQ